MRILVVSNMYPRTSGERRGVFVSRQVEALRRHGHEVEVVSVDTAASKLAYLTGLRRVRAAEKAFGPDLVHVHFGMTLVSALACKRPVVVTYHGSDLSVPWKRFITKVCEPKATARIVVSPSMRQAAGGDVTVIPCGVSVSELPDVGRSLARARLGLGEEPLVLFPSSPSRPEKRYGLFLETMALLEGFRHATLDEVAPDEVPFWLAAADCVVLTSSHEGSPVVTKEALCCGTRVVSVDVGDIASQIEGFDGCRVVSASPTDLAAGVRAVLDDRSPDRVRARSCFDVSHEALALTALYESVLGRDGGGSR